MSCWRLRREDKLLPRLGELASRYIKLSNIIHLILEFGLRASGLQYVAALHCSYKTNLCKRAVVMFVEGRG